MSELMVVPMARTPMMNNPPPTKPHTQIKGAGYGPDVLETLSGTRTDALKVGRGTTKGMERMTARRAYEGLGIVPCHLTRKQVSKLKKGGAITISPSQISDVAQTALALMPQQAQKVINSALKNKGVRVALKAGEDLVDRVSGGSILGSLGNVASRVGSVGRQALSASAPVLQQVGSKLAPVIIDELANQAKAQVSGMGTTKGMMRKTARRAYMSGSGSPYISPAYEQAMSYYQEGGSFLPSGKYGGSFMPSGTNGGTIQLGSPYQYIHSPAMNPFIATTGLAGYAPITNKRGAKVGGKTDVIGTLGNVAETAAKFAPLLALL